MSTRCNTVLSNALCLVSRPNAMQTRVTRIGIIMMKPLSRTQLVPNYLDSNESAFVTNCVKRRKLRQYPAIPTKYMLHNCVTLYLTITLKRELGRNETLNKKHTELNSVATLPLWHASQMYHRHVCSVFRAICR